MLCKQAKDSDLEEVEEKAKEEEKDAEKEKERKEVKVRKAKERAKAKERKEKENALEGQCVVSCHQEGHWGNECPNRHSVRNVEAEEHAPGTETYMHNPPNQDQCPRPNVVESGSIRQTTSRPDPRVVSRRVRGNFTPKPFYHIGTPPEEFPEVFPLNSEEER